jgi:hypothetical protein
MDRLTDAELAELRALADGGEATALEWRAAVLAAHPFLLDEVERSRALLKRLEDKGGTYREDATCPECGGLETTESIFEMKTKIEHKPGCELAALIGPSRVALVITDVAVAPDGTVTVTADDVEAQALLDSPEAPEEKAALDALAKDPEAILAEAKAQADDARARQANCSHPERVYCGEYRAANPPHWAWICPACLVVGHDIIDGQPPLDPGRFCDLYARIDPEGAARVRAALFRVK